MTSPQMIRRFLVIACLAALALPAGAQDNDEQPPEDVELTPQQKQIAELEEQAQLRTLQEQLRQQDQADALVETTDETARLEAELALLAAQQQKAMAQVQAEKEALAAEYELMQQKHQLELAELTMETERLTARAAQRAAEAAVAQAVAEEALAELRQQTAKLQARGELASAELQQQDLARKEQAAELEAEIASLQLQQQQQTLEHELAMQEMLNEQAKVQASLDTLALQLDLRSQKEDWQLQTNAEVPHPLDPVIDGTLHISDRRVALDLLIIEGTGQHIAERIDFFNNQSTEQPIFLVIDECLGGSVMEGWRIMQSIESSEAPVYVVVKSMAASMAAIITSQAEHSYAFPNALIMHHEIQSVAVGSTTEREEALEEMNEWEQRGLGPIAEKMGITVEEFRKRMYEDNSNGLWEVFADEALELKWINNLVAEVREEGIIKKPEGEIDSWWDDFFIFGTDENGKEYALLPRLNPRDVYYMYNPDNYYRRR